MDLKKSLENIDSNYREQIKPLIEESNYKAASDKMNTLLTLMNAIEQDILKKILIEKKPLKIASLTPSLFASAQNLYDKLKNGSISIESWIKNFEDYLAQTISALTY